MTAKKLPRLEDYRNRKEAQNLEFKGRDAIDDVRILPRAVCAMPVRAAPSMATVSKRTECIYAARRSRSIASPKLKKRYCSARATSYNRRQRSPTKASIIINSVVRGRWKLVIMMSTTFQSYGRVMNRRVRPSV